MKRDRDRARSRSRQRSLRVGNPSPFRLSIERLEQRRLLALFHVPPAAGEAGLRAAIASAGISGDITNTIQLDEGSYQLTDIAAGELVIQNAGGATDKQLTIVGAGPTKTTIEPGLPTSGPAFALWQTRIMSIIDEHTMVVLQDLALQGGNRIADVNDQGAARGGGIFIDGAAVTLNNVAVAGNKVTGANGITGADGQGNEPGKPGTGGGDAHGGGIYLASGSLTLVGATIAGNQAIGGAGGAGGEGGDGERGEDGEDGDPTGEIGLPGALGASTETLDVPGGHGVAGYYIYVSIDGQPYVAWQQNTEATSAVFTPLAGTHTYAFVSQAIDNVGNIEPMQISADLITDGSTVQAAPTTTVLTTSHPSGAIAGHDVKFTATVDSGSPVVPTGTVQFRIDGVDGVPVALASGSASFTTSTLTVGTHIITALYQGNAAFQNSQADIIQDIDPPSTVVGRKLFYAGSVAFDVDHGDGVFHSDNAIAPDKTPLPPGGQATFANVSSYVHGITGIIIDLAGGGTHESITAADFTFRMGNTRQVNDIAFQPAPLPATVLVRPGAGLSGADRIELRWANGQIKRTWLEVTVKATENTGLESADVFYFGSAPGDSGLGNYGAFATSGTDQIIARYRTTNDAAISSPFDYDRDGDVDGLDEIASRQSVGTLSLLTLNQSLAVTHLNALAMSLSIPEDNALATAVRSNAVPTGTSRLVVSNLTTTSRAVPASVVAGIVEEETRLSPLHELDDNLLDALVPCLSPKWKVQGPQSSPS